MTPNRPRPDLRTGAAAAYCTEQGRTTSPSLLEKSRARGPDEHRDRGPDFYRDDRGVCWYPQDALDVWVATWKAARRFREPGTVPANFVARHDEAA